MNDRTVIRPGGARPRRRRAESDDREPAPSHTPQAPSRGQRLAEFDETVLGSDYGMTLQRVSESADSNLHSTVGMISPLLNVVARMQKATTFPDIASFRAYVVEQIHYFETRHFGIDGDTDQEYYASFGLCCMIDELVVNTPWGESSNWREQSMLLAFHQQPLGDAVFFEILEKMMLEPEQNLPVLELYFIFLDLGYEGKYRDDRMGKREWFELKQELFDLVQEQRASYDVSLSPNWIGLADRDSRLVRIIPHWVIFATAGALLLSVYLAYNYYLMGHSNLVLRQFVEIADETTELQVTPANAGDVSLSSPAARVPRDTKPDYEALMMPLVRANEGVLELKASEATTVLRIRHSDLFTAGSERIAGRFVPIIEAIGGKLAGSARRISITGHSDDRPVTSSLRFPSNWELSRARAESVKAIMAPFLAPGQTIRTQGLADTKNLVANTNSYNRSLNRRVEVVIHH